MTDQRLFWIKVNRAGEYPRNMHSNCWMYEGTLSPEGYGHFGHTTAHRFAWEATYGPAPKDRVVCHWCDVRACVRPTHLWLGTKELNILDAMQKGHRAALVKGIRP